MDTLVLILAGFGVYFIAGLVLASVFAFIYKPWTKAPLDAWYGEWALFVVGWPALLMVIAQLVVREYKDGKASHHRST